jgi:hypothetical protein
MTFTTYTCAKCKAEDHDRSPVGVAPPAVLNCWKCGAGRGLDPADMQARHIGMFPSEVSHG